MTDIVERVRAAYPKRVAAVQSYIGPLPVGAHPMSREQADLKLAQMRPEEIATMAQTDPVAAEQAAQRLNLMDARAASQPEYPDLGPED